MYSPKIYDSYTGELTCVCGEFVENTEQGFVCTKCARTYAQCDECVPKIVWCKLTNWTLNYDSEATLLNPPYELYMEDGEKYIDDETVFMYKCLECNCEFRKSYDD